MNRMARKIRAKVYEGYRDAVGALLAAARGDDEGYAALRAYSPSLDSAAADALVAIGAGLMKELRGQGVDAEAIVKKWATNIAAKEAKGE